MKESINGDCYIYYDDDDGKRLVFCDYVNFLVNFAKEVYMSKRIIRFYNHHFNEFYLAQTEKVRKKILQTLVWIETLDIVPITILRSIESVKGLYEIRVEFSSNIFRIFCCFDEGSLIVLFNGFQKKTQKTPSNEIEKAKRLMKEYFDSKNENDEKQK